MSRALGDLQYKNPLNEITPSKQTNAQQVASADTNTNTATSPTNTDPNSDSNPIEKEDYITAEMSFTRLELQQEKQYMLALTSDGVTNALSDEKVMGMVGELLNSGISAGEVAGRVVGEAVEVVTARARLNGGLGGGSDNATCIVVFVNGVEAPPY